MMTDGRRSLPALEAMYGKRKEQEIFKCWE